MAIKFGLAEKRKEVLKKELERIIPLLIELGVKKIILFGSLPTGKVHRSSDIDLLIVQESNQRFLNRLEEVYRVIQPNCGVDFFVYTPEEFKEMSVKNPFVRRVVKEGRLLYEAGHDG
ncbi:MAG: nucleotidyltransferase domain-containing protein [Thermodesulfobacteriota bacterium]